MPRLLALAVLLGLTVGAAAQEPPTGDDALRRRLKKAVDLSLARFVRELRAELHRAVDEAVDRGETNALTTLLDELAPGARPSPKPPRVVIEPEQLVMVDRVLRRLDRLRDKSGGDHPQVKQLEASVRELLGPVADVARAPWHKLGLTVAPVTDAFRKQHDLPPGSGLSIMRVEEHSWGAGLALLKGDALVACSGKPVGLGQPGSVQFARFLAAGTGRHMSLELIREGRRVARTVILPGGTDLLDEDPKALMEAMLRKAVKEVLSDDRVVRTPKKQGGDKKVP